MYYHVSKDLKLIDKFIPRIPDESSMSDFENRNIKRVSTSTSIKGCLSAMPYGGSAIKKGDKLRVYTLNAKDIYNDKYLYFNNLVEDSLINNEYWLLQDVSIIDSYVIEIVSVNSSFERIVPYKYLKIYNSFLEKYGEYDETENYESLSPEEEEMLENIYMFSIISDVNYERVI